MIGQSERRIAQLEGSSDQLVQVGGSVQEGEARVAVELDVGDAAAPLRPPGSGTQVSHQRPERPNRPQGIEDDVRVQSVHVLG